MADNSIAGAPPPNNGSSLHRSGRRLAIVGCAAGGALLALNVLGLFVPLRSADIDGYRDFAGSETLPFETSIMRLEQLTKDSLPAAELVTEATRIFHEGVAHVAPLDVAKNGFAHYGMRVPATENWILYALSYLKPDTYRDYEFCYYRRALERGTGRCGQQALALVSFLAEQGIETGFIGLQGVHEVVTAKVDDATWYLLDPDYGAVLPFDIATAARQREAILPHYWSAAAGVNGIDRLYAGATRVAYGGPEARYARACPIERAAYALKWALPGFLFAPLLLFAAVRALKRRERSPD